MRRALRLLGPVAAFLLFGAASMGQAGLLQFAGVPADARAAVFFGYFVHIGLWLTGASIVVRLLDLFLWEGLLARALGREVPQLPRALTAVVVYILACTSIISLVFNQPIIGFWTTSGVVGLVIGFALRNIFMDIFMGLALNIDASYRVGDWVSVPQSRNAPEVIGEVVDIRWRATRIRTEDRRIVIVPNSHMGMVVVTNYSQPRVTTRFETFVTLDHAVPVERARRVLMAATRSVMGSSGFPEEPLPDVLVDEIGETGTRYKIRYWITPWEGTSPSRACDKVASAVLTHLRAAGLSPAYPKEDVFHAEMPARNLDSSSMADRVQLLHRIELFEQLEEAELGHLAEHARRRSWAAGEVIIRQGDQGKSMFVLAEGLLDVFVDGDQDGGAVRVGQLNAGEFFGEMSLLTGEHRSATVTANTDVLAYEISKEELSALLERRPELAEVLSDAVAHRRVRTSRALEENVPAAVLQQEREGLASKILHRMRNFFGSSVAAAH